VTDAQKSRIFPVTIVVLFALLGAATVLFDWGWTVWIIALLGMMLGAILILASLGLRTGVMIAATVVVVALAAGGAIGVRLDPIIPQGIAIGDTENIIGLVDDTIVVESTRSVRGLNSENGTVLWTYQSSDLRGDFEDAYVEGGAIVVVTTAANDDVTVLGLDTRTGSQDWATEVPAGSEAAAFTASTMVMQSPTGGTTALGLAAGAIAWSNDATALFTGSSEGYRVNRALSGSTTAAVLTRTDTGLESAIPVDLDSGETGTPRNLDDRDFFVFDDTVVSFSYDDDNRIGTGTAFDGSERWSTPVEELGYGSFVEGIGSAVRVTFDDHITLIAAADGSVSEVRIPEGWELEYGSAIAGLRYVAVYSDESGTASAAMDTVDGSIIELPGRGRATDGKVDAGTSNHTLIRLMVVDSVGGTSFRLVVVSESGTSIFYSGSADNIQLLDGLLRIDDRVMVLER
jgi:hypothetical protein